jgi:putative ABC transport system permease protein
VSWGDDLRVAAKSLWTYRFRSALSLLSIAIGAFAIVLMSSLASSGFETLRRGIEDLGGARLLLVLPHQPERAKAKAQAFTTGLTRIDQEQIFQDLPHLEGQCHYATLRDKSVLGDGGKNTRADLVAADSRFLEFFGMPLARGRPFSAADDAEHASVCVVGHHVAEQLGGGSPIGRWLTIGGARCRVIGELVDRQRYGVGLGFDWVKLVVMPIQSAADKFREVQHGGIFVARTDGVEHNDIVKRIINVRLSQRHHGLDDFRLLDFAGLLRNFYMVFAVMQALVGCIAGLALVVGGVGVMNMMLVSVSERVREIGIRKALGASPRHIRSQFLTEAALLSGSGGLIGASLGAGAALAASAVIARLLDTWVGLLSWPAVAAALGTALGTGVFFGWLPAQRASVLLPVEAIRR